jgi:hypothetical protein
MARGDAGVGADAGARAGGASAEAGWTAFMAVKETIEREVGEGVRGPSSG